VRSTIRTLAKGHRSTLQSIFALTLGISAATVVFGVVYNFVESLSPPSLSPIGHVHSGESHEVQGSTPHSGTARCDFRRGDLEASS
jgi:hypothetical protein